jgi:hypothetical protein
MAAPGHLPEPGSEPETAPDGTVAAAAVDVVRLGVLPSAADGRATVTVRLGHMEARAAVPAGGVRCRIPVRKTVDRNPQNPGDRFTWTITIPSTATALDGTACEVVALHAVDTASASPGVRFVLLSASRGGVIDGTTVAWADLGPYRPGDPPIVVTVSGQLGPRSEAGAITNTVSVAGTLDHCRGPTEGSGPRPIAAPTPLTGWYRLTGTASSRGSK